MAITGTSTPPRELLRSELTFLFPAGQQDERTKTLTASIARDTSFLIGHTYRDDDLEGWNVFLHVLDRGELCGITWAFMVTVHRSPKQTDILFEEQFVVKERSEWIKDLQNRTRQRVVKNLGKCPRIMPPIGRV